MTNLERLLLQVLAAAGRHAMQVRVRFDANGTLTYLDSNDRIPYLSILVEAIERQLDFDSALSHYHLRLALSFFGFGPLPQHPMASDEWRDYEPAAPLGPLRMRQMPRSFREQAKRPPVFTGSIRARSIVGNGTIEGCAVVTGNCKRMGGSAECKCHDGCGACDCCGNWLGEEG